MKTAIKLFILSLLLLTFIGVKATFSAFQDNLYCELTSESVRIYTQKNADITKCSSYIASLEYLIKKEFQDIKKIDVHISNKQDAEYRKEVKNSKKEKINNLQKIRLGIMQSMLLFENNFIKKSQEYMKKKLKKYQLSLESKISPLSKLGTGYQFSPYIQRQIFLITTQLSNIQDIYNATGTESFLRSIQNYLYFQKLLEGKYE